MQINKAREPDENIQMDYDVYKLISEHIIGKKTYSVYSGVAQINVIYGKLEEILRRDFSGEVDNGTIKLMHYPTYVRVDVWEGDSDLEDCPWWLLTYSDFISFCNDILKEEFYANR